METGAIFTALASPVRRGILEMLLEGPLSASEIASEFSLNRPSVSEHVHSLRSMGLVLEEARGRQRFFRLNAAPLSEVVEWVRPFEHYWKGRLRALAKALDEEKHS